MNEETTENKEPTDTGEGNKPTTTPLIDIANQAAERMENANKETARLQQIQAERDARVALGGKTEAGKEQAKEDESPADYTTRMQANE